MWNILDQLIAAQAGTGLSDLLGAFGWKEVLIAKWQGHKRGDLGRLVSSLSSFDLNENCASKNARFTGTRPNFWWDLTQYTTCWKTLINVLLVQVRSVKKEVDEWTVFRRGYRNQRLTDHARPISELEFWPGGLDIAISKNSITLVLGSCMSLWTGPIELRDDDVCGQGIWPQRS